MERWICWSGGKDSTASIIICWLLGMPITGIVFSEVMFSHEENISGENPVHIDWIYNVAIPIIENVFGYKVVVLRDKSDYVQEFNHLVKGSKKHPERNGKKSGFFIGGMCAGNGRLKMRPLRKFFKERGECEQIVGIAADEPKRLARLKKGKRSILAEQCLVEQNTYAICREYNLLSPIYGTVNRGGCWFCPNQSLEEFASLKINYPYLWEKLKEMSNDNMLISQNFKWGMTFANVEKCVDRHLRNSKNKQLDLFEVIENAN